MANITQETESFKALVKEATSVEQVLDLVAGASIGPQWAFVYAAEMTPVADAGFVLACLRNSDAGWPISRWLSNPIISPRFDAQCARYWARTLTSGAKSEATCSRAGGGLQWLLDHGRIDAVRPCLPDLERYVLRGKKEEMSAPRHYAYQALATAVGQAAWGGEALVRWRLSHPGAFLPAEETGELLLSDATIRPAVIADVIRVLQPGSPIFSVLAWRADLRASVVIRKAL